MYWHWAINSDNAKKGNTLQIPNCNKLGNVLVKISRNKFDERTAIRNQMIAQCWNSGWGKTMNFSLIMLHVLVIAHFNLGLVLASRSMKIWGCYRSSSPFHANIMSCADVTNKEGVTTSFYHFRQKLLPKEILASWSKLIRRF